MRTIVLNTGYEPIQIISWQRALCLILAEKAELVAEYSGKVVRSVSKSFPQPSVVRLKTYVRGIGRLRSLSRYNRSNLLLRDRFTCQYCGFKGNAKTVNIDHVLPRCRGGVNSWENTVAACHACNSKKGDLTPEEAGMKLRRQPRRPEWRDLIDEMTLKAVTDALSYLGEADTGDEEPDST